MTFKFESLHVWNRSIELTEVIFRLTLNLPKTFQYSLGDQLRRSILSVPTNIAEGVGRGFVKDQANFYRIAKGSIHEVASLLQILKRLDLIAEREFHKLNDEAFQISAMLGAMMKPKNLR